VITSMRRYSSDISLCSGISPSLLLMPGVRSKRGPVQGVIRLCQRKWPDRDGKRPEIGLSASPRGSDERPQRPAFCGVPAGTGGRKKNVAFGDIGGGTAIRTLGFQLRHKRPCPGAAERDGLQPKSANHLKYLDTASGSRGPIGSIERPRSRRRFDRRTSRLPVGSRTAPRSRLVKPRRCMSPRSGWWYPHGTRRGRGRAAI
jgi:hypothetical protein